MTGQTQGRMIGSPAHAGIDLATTRYGFTVLGSPAHAGIDPLTRPAQCHLGSPAHAGIDPWLDHGLRADAGRGSPAHAGIDPLTPNGEEGCTGFPRTRGDRPWSGEGLEREGSPAHAGIDPHGTGPAQCFCIGSPAHAGIDLEYRGSHGSYWFPRTRGDRPSWFRRHSLTVPPHTRG